jgi:signal peptidase II
MKPAYLKPFLAVAFIVLFDQIIKTWVRSHMFMGQDIHFLGDHGMLHYTENNGMAFGMELGGDFGKLVLTLFRIFAVLAIGYALVYLVKHKHNRRLF